MKIRRLTYLSLGSNQGNRLENLQNAVILISEEAGDVLKIASVYETPALGFRGNNFLNTCVEVSTYSSPEVLIAKLLDIENKLGRIRRCNNYTNRNIDIDILLFGDKVISSENLTIPHPRMLNRKFVLIPLVEIVEDKQHPTEKIDLSKCLTKCIDTSKIRRITEKLTSPISQVEASYL